MTDSEKYLAEIFARVESRGFTTEYQDRREASKNAICQTQLAPATVNRYNSAVKLWELFKCYRRLGKEDEPCEYGSDPTPQMLKGFAEFCVVAKSKFPSQATVTGIFRAFSAQWKRDNSKGLPEEVTRDVYNYIKTTLTSERGLNTKPRQKFQTTGIDILYLLRHLFGYDDHDYVHERARVQFGSLLSLFAGSAQRAGAIIVSSSYRGTNECLFYKHMTFNIKWNESRDKVVRWVTVRPEFTKGKRYRNDKVVERDWLQEHPVLALNFVFWVIVLGVADGAFRNCETLHDVLSVKPPASRDTLTLEWADHIKETPLFRMVRPEGPDSSHGLSFSSMRHHFQSLAKRDGFYDPLRVHGIRGGVVNTINSKVSDASRGQALGQKDTKSFLSYQSDVKDVDIQACVFNLQPNFECRDMERSMSNHRDTNVPTQVSAAALKEFNRRPDIVELNRQIEDLSAKISLRPTLNPSLTGERAKLYGRKAKALQCFKKQYVEEWWSSSNDRYTKRDEDGNNCPYRDTTPIFDIYRKYVSERSRLSENLFKEANVDSEIGRQCLEDMLSICKSVARVAYYPGLEPRDGRCPRCERAVTE
ncbi:hypothetical protein N7539_007705 [Penicillium diatomitis]|uniref:Uncharacterized protein n=1 Tax=Penicillium diatomitis TaxID=2819901 RepID=A0A9W9WUC0_9EURO|nr:uncharacterized protein N7539_007705 [Penicillium diatomitis]KAJ5475418.1 hypothetical protein N7539_007705 [Penicillium diatomitis]